MIEYNGESGAVDYIVNFQILRNDSFQLENCSKKDF